MIWARISAPGCANSPVRSTSDAGPPLTTPTLRDGSVTIRPIRLRDARVLERELSSNRSWLRQWEATNPHGPVSFDTRASIRSLQSNARGGSGLPFAIEVDGEFAGQLNVSSI